MAKAKKTTEAMDVLQKTVADLRLEISNMTMKLSKMQLKNTTSLRLKKDELARVLTQMNMQNRTQQTVESQEKKEEVK